MGRIHKDKLTPEMVQAAMTCEGPEQLVDLAQRWGFEMTLPEAEEYLAEYKGYPLSDEELDQVAGGWCAFESPCGCKNK